MTPCEFKAVSINHSNTYNSGMLSDQSADGKLKAAGRIS